MGTDSWTAGPGDIVLLVAWALALGGLVAWGIAESRRPVLVGGEATPVLRLDHVLAALFSIALVGLVVAVGSPYDRALTIPGTEARAMALDAFSSLDHCIACYSSRAGAVPPTIALGNETGFVDIQRLDDAPITGQPVRLRIRPRTEQGAFVISTVRVDFGDGAVETHHRQFADLDVTHVFDRAGEFSVHAWVKGSTGRVAEADVPVRIADP
jgi:hypothetical protein